MAAKTRVLGLKPGSAILIIAVLAAMVSVHFYPVEGTPAATGVSQNYYGDSEASRSGSTERAGKSSDAGAEAGTPNTESSNANLANGVPTDAGAPRADAFMISAVEWLPPIETVEPEKRLTIGERERADEQLRKLGLSEEEIASGNASLGFRFADNPPVEENAATIEENQPSDAKTEEDTRHVNPGDVIEPSRPSESDGGTVPQKQPDIGE